MHGARSGGDFDLWTYICGREKEAAHSGSAYRVFCVFLWPWFVRAYVTWEVYLDRTWNCFCLRGLNVVELLQCDPCYNGILAATHTTHRREHESMAGTTSHGHYMSGSRPSRFSRFFNLFSLVKYLVLGGHLTLSLVIYLVLAVYIMLSMVD
ncbi:unnamed protein product [Calypogeia fissa]